MKRLWSAMVGVGLGIGMLGGMAMAQTIYEPVRYQYGAYGEVFYGGGNPAIATGHYVYLPPELQAAYTARRLDATRYPYPSPYMLAAKTGAGGTGGVGYVFYSPYSPGARERSMDVPYIFSDFLPYEEVGQFGFTVDEARNEAYARVPRYQVGGSGNAGVAVTSKVAPLGPAEKNVQADPRAKAIPLLDWAKHAYRRNPALYRALIQTARKFDPDRTAAVVKEIEAGK